MIRSIHNNYHLVPNAGNQKKTHPSNPNQERVHSSDTSQERAYSSNPEKGEPHTVAEASRKEKENTAYGGKVGINVEKLARMLAAAKTKAQLQAVITKIQQDLKECAAGKAQGMEVDEKSVQQAQNILNQAYQRMTKEHTAQASAMVP